MQFNSIGYIFAFLPIVLLVYYGLALSPLAAARRPVLILATLVFYAFGGSEFIPLLLASVTLNFAASRIIDRVRDKPEKVRAAAIAVAVLGNLLLLGYFKYFNFLLRILNGLFASGFEIERVALPLGISFFTFIQIGYLVDVSRGRFRAAGPLDYANFVLFFPQLLAGPLVLFRETAPQLAEPVKRGAIGRNILIGLVIFAIGLFKKTVIADTAALYADPVFSAARSGTVTGFLDTWIAALCYTAQVYFDFSGYSDMAIGTARMLGVVLPLNFHSPLRSQSIVELWRRWHITLGRWVQSYVFQPISMPLARFAGGRNFGDLGALVCGVIIPTIISMLVVGIWHGAGWTFVLFGLMQGLYMATNELFALLRKDVRKARRKAKLPEPRWRKPLAQAATLLAFVVAIIPFGSPALKPAGRMFLGMAGSGGWLNLPEAWPLGLAGAIACVIALYLAVYLAPNTQQIMGRFEPVLEWAKWRKTDPAGEAIEWRMSRGWTLAAALVLFLGVAFIMRGSAKFIYFNF